MPGARNVTKGATSVTAVAPKFSDALTLFQPGGRFYPSSQRLNQTFPRDYIVLSHPDFENLMACLMLYVTEGLGLCNLV